MKNNRATGPVRTPVRIPVAALSPDHPSSLAAFERWQRESPHAGPLSQADGSSPNPPKPNEPIKN